MLKMLVNRDPLEVVGLVEDALGANNIMDVVDVLAGFWPQEVATNVSNTHSISHAFGYKIVKL